MADSEAGWPPDEGALGVVGVAPWATIDFLREFYALVDAGKDWHYPRVLIDTNTKIPSRGRHLELGERDPSPFIRETIAELAQAGATAVVVVCNTAHILAETWAEDAPVPVIDIVDSTVGSVQASAGQRVAVLASNSLSRYDLYGRRLEAAGLVAERPGDAEQADVARLIESVKVHGRTTADDEPVIARLVRWGRSSSADVILLGCTELSGLAPRLESEGFRVVDSNKALAAAALAAVTRSSGAPRGR